MDLVPHRPKLRTIRPEGGVKGERGGGAWRGRGRLWTGWGDHGGMAIAAGWSTDGLLQRRYGIKLAINNQSLTFSLSPLFTLFQPNQIYQPLPASENLQYPSCFHFFLKIRCGSHRSCLFFFALLDRGKFCFQIFSAV